jgi:hypothetical protein
MRRSHWYNDAGSCGNGERGVAKLHDARAPKDHHMLGMVAVKVRCHIARDTYEEGCAKAVIVQATDLDSAVGVGAMHEFRRVKNLRNEYRVHVQCGHEQNAPKYPRAHWNQKWVRVPAPRRNSAADILRRPSGWTSRSSMEPCPHATSNRPASTRTEPASPAMPRLLVREANTLKELVPCSVIISVQAPGTGESPRT